MTLLTGADLRVVRGARVLLREVSLEAHAGKVLGVLGPSGAGKSTLFRVLAGDEDLDSGKVTLKGNDVTRWALWKRARAGLGYIPQTPSVLMDLSVRENLSTFFSIVKRDGGLCAAMAAKVDLTERMGVRAGDLSAGERRRLEVARALVGEPAVLICDEPFAGVDPQGDAKIGALLRGVADGGTAVVLADHHVSEALAICDRAILLLDGAVAVDATPTEFRNHPLVQGRYLGTWAPHADAVTVE